MWVAAAAWGDVDNSGRASVLVTGWFPIQQGVWGSTTRVYINLSGTWQEVFTLAGRTISGMNWVDFDGEGDLDIFYTGEQATAFWTNTLAFHRDALQPPLNLALSPASDACPIANTGSLVHFYHQRREVPRRMTPRARVQIIWARRA